MLTAVKTTACGSGLRPVLTAAARGAVRCIWPGRRNRVAAEQRNPLIKCTHPEVPGRHLPRTLRIDLPERRWVSFIEHRGSVYSAIDGRPQTGTEHVGDLLLGIEASGASAERA